MRSLKTTLLSFTLPMMVIANMAMAENAAFAVNENSFRCITQMTPVRGFFVDNLRGDAALVETRAIAESKTGGDYPVGSVVQLVPTEVMVKQPAGTSPATRDWEFFELNVSEGSSKIAKRGFADVNNHFGQNCFACHIKAKPQWDLLCEKDHGCDPIPLTSEMIRALQKGDPRCSPPNTLTPQEQAILTKLAPVFFGPAKPKPAARQ